jgi:hypothetical protein
MSTTDKRDEPVARTDEDLSKVNGGTVFPPHVSGIVKPKKEPDEESKIEMPEPPLSPQDMV